MTDPRLAMTLRLLSGGAIALGPGKADLLDAIAVAGSISGAARAMGLSYRRAWLLVETMNAAFARPLVTASKGGEGGGGAALTAAGADVLRHYRAMTAAVQDAARPESDILLALLRPPSMEPQP